MAFGVAMILAACSALAQPHYTSAIVMQTAMSTPEGHPRPVRNWNTKYSVGVVGDTSAIGLSLIDHSAFFAPSTGFAPVITEKHITTLMLPYSDTNTTITDIYVANDYAFFCGYVYGISAGNQAIVGYVYLPDIITGSATLHCGIIPGIERLKRIVAYNTEGEFRVYAIGENVIHPAVGATYTWEGILEIADILSPTPIQYHIEWLPASASFKKEYLYDVLLTNDYVVFVGHNYSPPFNDMLHYRMVERSHPPLSAMIEDVYFMPVPSEVNSRVASTALEDNLIAVSYVNWNASSFSYSTRLRIIDLNVADNVNSQQMIRPDKIDPIMIDYLPQKGQIEMLQSYNNPYDFSSWFPSYSSSYTSTILSPSNGNDYQYVRCLNEEMFIASSGPFLYLQDPSISFPASDPFCPSEYEVPIEPLPNLPIAVLNNPLYTTSGYFNISIILPSSSSILNKVCYSEQ